MHCLLSKVVKAPVHIHKGEWRNYGSRRSLNNNLPWLLPGPRQRPSLSLTSPEEHGAQSAQESTKDRRTCRAVPGQPQPQGPGVTPSTARQNWSTFWAERGLLSRDEGQGMGCRGRAFCRSIYIREAQGRNQNEEKGGI